MQNTKTREGNYEDKYINIYIIELLGLSAPGFTK